MISGIAHELNNPLAAVLGYAQLVRSADVDDKLARRLGMIHDEARRCQRIVHNLLSFARRHEPERKPLSLNEVVRSVLGLVGYQLRVAGIDVRCELDPDLPSIHGDRHHLQQAVLNLVTNAHHALEDGGGGGALSLRTRRCRHGVTVEVSDDGPGIPEAHLRRIYDPFFTTKESGRGTGLGLSIVYGIVTAHGGKIRCRSRPALGTTFEIELPRGEPRKPDPAPGREGSAPHPRRAGRILVIDDEEVVARLICETLAADGHRVVRALGRDDALGRLAESEFDVVVVDLKAPGVSADEFREELCRRQRDPARGVLFVTGDTVSGEPERHAMRSGVGVLHKPFDLDELLDAVRSRL
jgi:CheY-like chemotaxis protein/anti-sigma regulatory factor (Ser/Thr protein kinase)